MKKWIAVSLASFLLFTTSLWAGAPVASIPQCLDKGRVLAVDNAQALQWKFNTANQFAARSHIKGVVSYVYPDKNGHNHFQINVGTHGDETIEVIYNKSFGSLPQIKSGITVEACGDYITSNAPTAQYEPSPDGAIIHWVHRSDKPSKHDHGFLVISGKLYGFKAGR